MARKLTALGIALLFSLIPRAVLGVVFGQTQDIVAELWPGAYPFLIEGAFVFAVAAAYAAAFVAGFGFWAGTSETWRASALWAAAGSAGLQAATAPGAFVADGALKAGLVAAACVAGAYHGAWWGEDNKDDPRVEGVQGFVFGLNPFRLS